MASLRTDQAEGLRRLLVRQQPRVVTFFSVMHDASKTLALVNLGAALSKSGNKTLVIDASAESAGLPRFVGAEAMPALEDVVKQERNMYEAIRIVPQGFAFTNVAKKVVPSAMHPDSERYAELSGIMSEQADITLINGGISADDTLPLPVIREGQVLIHLSSHPASVKGAYLLLKKLYTVIGCRSFGMFVSDAMEREAKLVFQNMQETARRYLAVDLEFAGFVPQDVLMARAGSLRKSVVDVYPSAVASQAFMLLAQRFLSREVTSVAGEDRASLRV